MESKRNNTLPILALVVGLLCVAGCSVVAVGGAALFFYGAPDDDAAGAERDFITTFDEFSFDTLDDWPGAQGFAGDWQIEWPESARDIRLSEDGFMDPYYNVKMTVDPDDLDALIASPACQGLKDQADSVPRDAFTTEPIPWWTPETATTFAECNGPEPSTRSIHTFLDQSDPDETILYVLVVLT